MPMRYTPMRSTPMRCTLVRCTPRSYTPMKGHNHSPILWVEKDA